MQVSLILSAVVQIPEIVNMRCVNWLNYFCNLRKKKKKALRRLTAPGKNNFKEVGKTADRELSSRHEVFS